MSAYEHDKRFLRWCELVEEAEPIKFRHLDVQEDQFRLFFPDHFESESSVGGGAYQVDFRVARQKQFEAIPRDGLIINDQRTDGLHGWFGKTALNLRQFSAPPHPPANSFGQFQNTIRSKDSPTSPCEMGFYNRRKKKTPWTNPGRRLKPYAPSLLRNPSQSARKRTPFAGRECSHSSPSRSVNRTEDRDRGYSGLRA